MRPAIEVMTNRNRLVASTVSVAEPVRFWAVARATLKSATRSAKDELPFVAEAGTVTV